MFPKCEGPIESDTQELRVLLEPGNLAVDGDPGLSGLICFAE